MTLDFIMPIVAMFILFSGLMNFVSQRYHMLMSLMSLELIAMFMFTYIVLICSNTPSSSLVAIYFLVLTACEGALGLSVIINLVRTKGNELSSGMSTALW